MNARCRGTRIIVLFLRPRVNQNGPAYFDDSGQFRQSSETTCLRGNVMEDGDGNGGVVAVTAVGQQQTVADQRIEIALATYLN